MGKKIDGKILAVKEYVSYDIAYDIQRPTISCSAQYEAANSTPSHVVSTEVHFFSGQKHRTQYMLYTDYTRTFNKIYG